MKKAKSLRILLVWCLVLALTACGTIPAASVEETKQESAAEVEETPQPERTPEAETVERPKPISTKEPLKLDEAETPEDLQELLVYRLTEEQLEAFDTQLAFCREQMQSGADYEVVLDEIEKLYEQAMDIQEQVAIAEVLYYCHMNDRKAMKTHLDATQALSELILKYNELLLDIYHGDNESYKQVFDDWTETDIKILTGQTADSMRLEVRNAELLTEVYALNEAQLEEQIGGLYSEFISNANQIGAEYGYENYYEYASQIVYKRDYGKQEREVFREYVKQYIVPIYNVVVKEYEASLYALSLTEADLVMDLMYESRETLKEDYLGNYLHSLPESAGEGMEHMFTENHYILMNAEDSYVGAFTADIGEPFCYFGPDSQNVFVMIHELGHYYADLCEEEDVASFDLAETQSQGNEMLFLSYLKKELPEKVHNALLYYELYLFMNTIIQATVFDEFEEAVYDIVDVSTYETTDYDKLMYDIMLGYGIDDPYDIIPDGMSWLWKNVGIESAVYYLSYAVSAAAALNLYNLSTVDYDGAVEAYCKLQENVDYSSGFMKVLEQAGITSVFEEETYIKMLEILPGQNN